MIAQFIEVWQSLGTFLVSLFPDLISLFWTAGVDGGAGQLTFVGVMAVVMGGIGLFLTIFTIIRSFFSFHG